MFQLFGSGLDRLLIPSLDWVQVEVTSFCNARCVYCPHTVYRDSWVSRHLSLQTFGQILPVLPKTDLVYLQGWGEPFLCPDLFAMATMVKEAGCRVGVTTNGTLLDYEKIAKLVKLGVDVVAFSLAGVDEKNDLIRVGTKIDTVFQAIRQLKRAKEEHRSDRPAIHVAYMLLRSGIEDLHKLPAVLEGMDINQIVVSSLDFVPSRKLQDEVIVLMDRGASSDLIGRLETVIQEGKERGLSIHLNLNFRGERSGVCTENVQRSLFISADGAVSPCAFANVPVSHASLFVSGREREYQRLTFGNIHEQSLRRIWKQKAYANFRNSFYSGRLSGLCEDCPKLSGA